MKKSLLILVSLFASLIIMAQVPETFSYQAVVRDAAGTVIANQPVGIQITVIQGILPGTPVYQEIFSQATNGFGLVNVAVGSGNVQFGNSAAIDWAGGPYFMNVSIDPSGGTAYTDMGTVQLLSVPYALFAKNAGNTFSGNYYDLTNKPVLTGDVTGQVESNIVEKIQGMDISANIPANGQVLKWNNLSQTWEPSDDQLGAAGTTDGVVTGASFTGTTTKTLTLIRSNGLGDVTAVFTDLVNDADADPTNELQDLSIAGNILTISDGNTVTLPVSSYTAGAGINITGNSISNTAPDQTVVLTGSGASNVSGTYPNFTISSTDNNTTYSAGTGMNLSGTTFNAQTTNPLWNANQLQNIAVNSTAPANGQVLKYNGTNWAPAADNGTTYTAGTGINITGTTITNTFPDQTVVLTGSGATSVTGTYPNFTISSADNNTTYSAGTGLALTGTQFSNTQTLAQTLANGNNAGSYNINMNNQSITGANVLGLRSDNAAYIDMYYGHIYDYSGSHGVDGQVLRVRGTSPNTYVRWENTTSLITAGTGLSYSGNTLNSVWSINGTHIYNNNTGNVGVGLNVPNARLTIKGNSASTGLEPLFEIKNRAGQTVFIVYEDSVRIFIDDDPAKTNKGAFAVSGRNTSKAFTNNFFWVTPDSSRVYTGDADKGFGVRNINGTAKESYMQLSPKNYLIGQFAGTSITTGLYNSVFGFRAAGNMTSGSNNTVLGYKAGYSITTGYSNVILGKNSGYGLTAGYWNVIIGDSSGYGNVGAANVMIGYESGVNHIGSNATFIGTGSGLSNTNGDMNTFIGNSAGAFNTTGSENTYVGTMSGVVNGTGNGNTIVGYNSGMAGDYLTHNYSKNTFVGANIARNITASADKNTVVGYSAGYNLWNGTGNVFIGYRAGFADLGSNKLYIANGSSSDSTLLYGEFNNKILKTPAKVGINNTGSPLYYLHAVDATTGNDDPAIYGEHIATAGWGVGIQGRGGYKGVMGTVNTNTTFAVYGGEFTGTNSGSGTSYGIYATASSSGTAYAGYFQGNVHVNGTLSKSGGTFRIDHPLDPENKYLNHAFVESPDMKNIYDGTVIIDNYGEAVVTLPDYFSTLNTDFRYQLTSIGQPADLYIKSKLNNNKFVIAGGVPGMEVSWQITGVRNDPWAKAHPVVVEEMKKTEEKGKYLNPELYDKGIDKSLYESTRK